MGRKEKFRSVESPPRTFRFVPERSGIQCSTEAETGAAESWKVNNSEPAVVIRLDEFEAIRLSDKLGYDHAQAAGIMGISRPTFTRLLNRARHKAAEFIVDGKSMEISGGAILFSDNVFCCRDCSRPFKWEEKNPPTCPVCNNLNIIKARGDCNGDCGCCAKF